MQKKNYCIDVWIWLNPLWLRFIVLVMNKELGRDVSKARINLSKVFLVGKFDLYIITKINDDASSRWKKQNDHKIITPKQIKESIAECDGIILGGLGF